MPRVSFFFFFFFFDSYFFISFSIFTFFFHLLLRFWCKNENCKYFENRIECNFFAHTALLMASTKIYMYCEGTCTSNTCTECPTNECAPEATPMTENIDEKYVSITWHSMFSRMKYFCSLFIYFLRYFFFFSFLVSKRCFSSVYNTMSMSAKRIFEIVSKTIIFTTHDWSTVCICTMCTYLR